MKTEELLREIESLPVDERARVADSVLRTLNPPDSRLEKKWAEVARNRLEQINTGEVQLVPGEQIFAKIRQRFA